MHFLTVRGLSIEIITSILSCADGMKKLVEAQGGDERLKNKVMALLFCEPSTRTRCSFQAAMQRLGGTVIHVDGDASSMKKGETLQDTIETLSCYCDLITMRHPEKGSAQEAANHSSVPVINAGSNKNIALCCQVVWLKELVCAECWPFEGDGTGEHPTQALLDLFTIKAELGGIGGGDKENPMVVALVGDLKNG